MKRPTKISDRSRPIRLSGLPARIRLEDSDPAHPEEIRFSIEPYDVPEGGGELREFRPGQKKPNS